MKYVLKYQKGKKTRRASMPDFKSMPSIYNSDGNIDYSIFGEGYDLKTIDNAILKARLRGWGSVNIGNTDYTLYQKDNNGKIILDYISEFDPTKKYTESQLAAYNWNNRRNPNVLSQTNQYAVGYTPTATETPKVEEPVTTPVSTTTSLNNFSFQNSRILGTPSTGRNSKLRTLYTSLFNDSNYLNNNKLMIGFMNKYYGMGWGDPNSSNYNKNALNELLLTATYVLNNGDLLSDRRGKGQDYLAMESSRLNRNLGGYNFTYRDMLNYFKSNLDKFNMGKYKGNNDKFMQELYELGASRNGMLEHELRRLFGDNYAEYLKNVEPNSFKKGGLIKMLFI